MIFLRIKSRLILAGVCFFLSFCAEKEKPLIQVGSLKISTEELNDAYLFNPYLASVNNDQEAFKIVLYSLVAQKTLANSFPVETDNLFLERIEKEAVIEQFWEKAIFDSIEISENDIYKEFLKQNTLRITRVYVYDNFEDALKDSILPQNFRSSVIDSVYYDPQNPFSDKSFKLNTNQLSEPIKSGELFFRLKLLSEIPLSAYSQSDFEKQKNSLEKSLKNRKAQHIFRDRYQKMDDEYGYEINNRNMEMFLKKIVDDFYDEQLKNETNSEIKLEQTQNKIVVYFKYGLSWNDEMLLKQINIAPYPLNFTDKNAFARSLKIAIKNILQDESLYKYAKAKNYIDNIQIKQQVRIWRDNRNYKKALANIIRGADRDSTNYLINKKLTSYFSDITISKNKKIKKPDQKRSNMLVLKTHFPQRTLMPIIQPLFINKKNREHLDSLFTQ